MIMTIMVSDVDTVVNLYCGHYYRKQQCFHHDRSFVDVWVEAGMGRNSHLEQSFSNHTQLHYLIKAIMTCLNWKYFEMSWCER